MIIDLSSLSSSTQSWARATNTADVGVTTNGTTQVLSGIDAAAYLFGQALSTIRFQNTLDGVQLTDGRFQFPPDSGQWVSLSEVADALRYKYGVDPLIEFAPGLGLRGYSVADVNGILDLLNQNFAGQFSLAPVVSGDVQSATQTTFNAENAAAPGSTATYNAAAVSTLFDTQSTPALTGATEAELREALTVGGDLYTDRYGAFYMNSVPTRAIDVAAVSRLLVHDNISSEYKVLMDEYTQRNNLIAEARGVLDGGYDGLARSTGTLSAQYGTPDVLSELTAGQYSDAQLPLTVRAVGSTSLTFFHDPQWATGTPISVYLSGATQSTVVNVRNLGNGEYSFYRIWQDASNVQEIPIDPSKISGPFTRPTANNLNGLIGVSLATSSNDPNNPNYFKNVPVYYTNLNGYKGYSLLINNAVGWSTGARVRVPADIYDNSSPKKVSLHAGIDYFVRDEGYDAYGNTYWGIFDTQANAIAGGGTGRMVFGYGINNTDLTEPFEPDVYYALANDPHIPDGTKVQFAATGTLSGVVAGQDYYVRSLGGGKYNVFTSAAAAMASGNPRPTSGLVSITAPMNATMTVVSSSITSDDFNAITALLNTLISNKVRDGDLDQAKLQSLTAQLQTNTEAMTALIKAFSDMSSQLAQVLR